jgi:O-acetyl-ADP-ribose deacetylase (regulator of RNase III)
VLIKVKGDLLKLAEQGEFDVIVHGCNCFNLMGGGIAKSIREKWPQVYAADCKTKAGDYKKLGTWTLCDIDVNFCVVNAYTQYHISNKEDVFEYTAFQLILEKLIRFARNDVLRFGMPYIGMGLAGGDKDRIMGMIENFAKEVTKLGSTVTLVDFAK